MVGSQHTISLSSAGAELYALGRLCAELLLLANVLECMKMKSAIPLARTDSDSARSLSNRVGVGKQRHIHTRMLWLQEKIRRGELAVKRVNGVENCADVGTKHLDHTRLFHLVKQMGLVLQVRQQLANGLIALSCIAVASAAEFRAVGTTETNVTILDMCGVVVALVALVTGYSHVMAECPSGKKVKHKKMAEVISIREDSTQTEAVLISDTDMVTAEQVLHSLTCDEIRALLRSRRSVTPDLKADIIKRLAKLSRPRKLE